MSGIGTAPVARTSFIASSDTSLAPSSSAPPALSSELEEIFARLSTHRTALGYLLVTRGVHPSIIRHSGVVFEGEQGRRYASAVARIVDSVQTGLDEIRGEDIIGVPGTEGDNDEVKLLRIRTKRHELMISPDDKYLLAILHDPGI